MQPSSIDTDRLTGSVAAGPLKLLLLGWQGVQDRLVEALARARVTPNQVTIASTGVTLASAPLAASGHFTAAGLIYAVGCAGDLVDGALARRVGRSTKAGAFLDSTLDRVVEAIVLAAIAIGLGTGAGYLVAFLLMASSMMFSYVKARAEGLGVKIEVRWMQRADRILWVAVTLLLAPFLAYLGGYPASELIIASFAICVGFAVVGVALRFREAMKKLA